MKKALITGITGQDGSYLAEYLLKRGYEVHGIKRRASSLNSSRIDHIYLDEKLNQNRFFLHYGDVVDSLNLFNLISQIRPDEIYNLAAQSHVKVSFETPEYTANADGLGVLRILETIRSAGLHEKTKFYQASTSEIFGKVHSVPQDETTPFYPRSPYGVAKLFGYWTTVNYREAYSLFASNGILFNHESPRRGETFVTQKIVNAAASLFSGKYEILELGNLEAKRDWGHASDFVSGMHKILQHNEPDDFVLSTGRTETVKRFAEMSYRCAGIELSWSGHGLDEVGINSQNGQVLIRVNPKYFRPSEVDILQGDYSKAKIKLGWEPKIKLEDLVVEMFEHASEKYSGF